MFIQSALCTYWNIAQHSGHFKIVKILFFLSLCLERVNSSTPEHFQLTAPPLISIENFYFYHCVISYLLLTTSSPWFKSMYLCRVVLGSWMPLKVACTPWSPDTSAGAVIDPAGKCHVTETPAEINVWAELQRAVRCAAVFVSSWYSERGQMVYCEQDKSYKLFELSLSVGLYAALL